MAAPRPRKVRASLLYRKENTKYAKGDLRRRDNRRGRIGADESEVQAYPRIRNVVTRSDKISAIGVTLESFIFACGLGRKSSRILVDINFANDTGDRNNRSV